MLLSIIIQIGEVDPLWAILLVLGISVAIYIATLFSPFKRKKR